MKTRAIALVILVGASAAHAGPEFDFQRSGTFTSGKSYAVRIREAPYVPVPGEKEDDGSRWGIDGGFPSSSCVEFSLSLNGQAITIYRKLFTDLSHLQMASIVEEKALVRVSVTGGDAAGSFTAQFFFHPHEIERVVHHNEVPNSVWERTIVHNSCPELCDD